MAGESGEAIEAHTRQGEQRPTAETGPRSRRGPGASNDPARSSSERRGEAVDGGRVEGGRMVPYSRGKTTPRTSIPRMVRVVLGTMHKPHHLYLQRKLFRKKMALRYCSTAITRKKGVVRTDTANWALLTNLIQFLVPPDTVKDPALKILMRIATVWTQRNVRNNSLRLGHRDTHYSELVSILGRSATTASKQREEQPYVSYPQDHTACSPTWTSNPGPPARSASDHKF